MVRRAFIAGSGGALHGAVYRGEGMFCEALRAASQLGARPQVAHCHVGLTKLYQRTAKREQAQEHLTEMDMRFWLEQAEAARDT